MNAVEIIALIFAIMALVKMVFLLLKPKILMDFGMKMVEKTNLMKGMLIAMILVVGYFLLTSMTIVEVFAASMLGIFAYALIFTQYPKMMKSFYKAAIKDMNKLWLPIVIWIVVAVWVLIVLFV